MQNLLITDFIPHRYPFLLLDALIEWENRKRAVGIKNISLMDPWMQGHFPQHPIMPASMIIEAMAQTAATIFSKDPEFSTQLPLYDELKNVHFKKSAYAGDQLRLETDVIKLKPNEITVEAKALVDGKVIAECTFIYAMTSKASRPHIHPTASVHASASLGKDVVVGPYTMIGENVIIGDRTVLEANILIERDTQIGEDCHVHFGTVIGSNAQDLKYKGERTAVIIGDRNDIREYVTINRSTGKDTSTVIGSDNIFMTSVHIGHNCVLGNNIIIANTCNLAGHCFVEDRAIIGGMTGIHQFTRIGKGAMVGGYSRITQDIAPFTLCEGNPAVIRNINAIGLKRSGSSAGEITEIKHIFRTIFRSNKVFSEAKKDVQALTPISENAKHLIDFCLADSPRGLTLKKEASDTETITN